MQLDVEIPSFSCRSAISFTFYKRFLSYSTPVLRLISAAARSTVLCIFAFQINAASLDTSYETLF